LLINLKELTDKKVNESEKDTIVFPGYRSHKLLLQMEEKELRFKQLQRMKELAKRDRSVHHRNSELYHSTNDSVNYSYRHESNKSALLIPKILNTIDTPSVINKINKSQVTSARNSLGFIENKHFNPETAENTEYDDSPKVASNPLSRLGSNKASKQLNQGSHNYNINYR